MIVDNDNDHDLNDSMFKFANMDFSNMQTYFIVQINEQFEGMTQLTESSINKIKLILNSQQLAALDGLRNLVLHNSGASTGYG